MLVICGPTASGKTALAVQLAKQLSGEVVTADSMQIYRGMDIGTAKPNTVEMEGIPHHLLDIVNPCQEFSLVQYLALAKQTVEDIHNRGKLPILAGGTGLYIHSLVDNIQFAEIPTNPQLRSQLEGQAKEKGAQYLWQQLEECDPLSAQKLHPNNLGRVIRALEVYRLTGTTMTQLQHQSRQAQSPYQLCMIALGFQNRETLYNRIDTRVQTMMDQGLLSEAKRVWENGVSKTAYQAIGYKELFDYFAGESTLDEAVELIKRRSRNYAKRQLTWLRRDTRIHWLYWEQYAEFTDLLESAVQLTQNTLYAD